MFGGKPPRHTTTITEHISHHGVNPAESVRIPKRRVLPSSTLGEQGRPPPPEEDRLEVSGQGVRGESMQLARSKGKVSTLYLIQTKWHPTPKMQVPDRVSGTLASIRPNCPNFTGHSSSGSKKCWLKDHMFLQVGGFRVCHLFSVTWSQSSILLSRLTGGLRLPTGIPQ